MLSNLQKRPYLRTGGQAGHCQRPRGARGRSGGEVGRTKARAWDGQEPERGAGKRAWAGSPWVLLDLHLRRGVLDRLPQILSALSAPPPTPTHTQTHTQTHTDRHTHTDTHTDTHRHTDTHTHRHTQTDTHRPARPLSPTPPRTRSCTHRHHAPPPRTATTQHVRTPAANKMSGIVQGVFERPHRRRLVTRQRRRRCRRAPRSRSRRVWQRGWGRGRRRGVVRPGVLDAV